MIGASKILTVSYGTFSCTLEGFDDPFNTMRAIAEYFRDLAAEDRYFGAEPPTPDAAMLHRIAEREINRRVEANIQENGVILRAGDVEVAHGPRRSSARKEPLAVMAAGVQPTGPTLADATAADDGSVASRLTRLREAQAAAELAEAAQAGAGAEAVPALEDEEAEADAASPMLQSDLWQGPSAEETFDEDAVIEEPVVEDARADDSSFMDTSAEDTIASVLADLEATFPAPDNATEKLDETSALADIENAATTDLAAEDPAVEDLAAEGEAANDWAIKDRAIEDRAAEGATLPDERISDALAESPAHSELAKQPSDDDVLRATLGAMIDPDGDDEFDALPEAVPAPRTHEVVEAGKAALATADETSARPASIETAAVAEAEMTVETSGKVAEPAAARVWQVEAAPPVDPRVADRLQRARARVIKIRRTDVRAPVEVAAEEPVAAKAELPPSALSPEAEAELQRELADFEADLAPVVAAPAQDLPAAMPAEPPKPAEPNSADDAVNRLISQTNAAMEGPENKRRLAAIAHLKAAVAATFADRKSNAAPAQPGPAERMDPYRDDLDRVVRPRRPALVAPDAQEPSTPTTRPQIESRPAPLVLVSEQRIDRPAAVAAKPFVAPVRPRRVTADMMPAEIVASAIAVDPDSGVDDLTTEDVNNIFADPSQPFAEFAERLGAVTMPDLMEAAAAYCALQLGRDQFTRPLLLQQIADLPGAEDFNREDCLRGFGTLLRDGRVQKIKRGQFKLSGQSRYLAEAKRQAG